MIYSRNINQLYESLKGDLIVSDLIRHQIV